MGIGNRETGNRADKSGTDPRNKKKPVPLPRSKLPASEIVNASPPLQQQQQPAKSSFGPIGNHVQSNVVEPPDGIIIGKTTENENSFGHAKLSNVHS